MWERDVERELTQGAENAWRDNRLYGSWRIVGARGISVDADGTRTEVDAKPEGVLIFTPAHRMIAFIVQPGRKPATNDEERLALFKSTTTYSGRFRLEPGRYILNVDWSSTALNQDEQIREYTIDGDAMRIEVALHPNIHDNTKQNANTLFLEREK